MLNPSDMDILPNVLTLGFFWIPALISGIATLAAAGITAGVHAGSNKEAPKAKNPGWDPLMAALGNDRAFNPNLNKGGVAKPSGAPGGARSAPDSSVAEASLAQQQKQELLTRQAPPSPVQPLLPRQGAPMTEEEYARTLELLSKGGGSW